MAFNFLGTINGIEKFEEFEEFVRIEANKMEIKIDTLKKEKSRMFELINKFKKSDLYLRKEFPLSERADIDYIKKPRTRRTNSPKIIDSLNAYDVNNLKKFVLDPIKHKREVNENKIKKIRDRVEQIQNEIDYILKSLDTYEQTLNSIKNRFNLPEFAEAQRVAYPDQKDIDPDIPVTRKDAGREIINGKTFYLALSISGSTRTITFDTAAPTVQPFQLIELVNGRNIGIYTVQNIISSTTIQVFDDLVDENPATTKVSLG